MTRRSNHFIQRVDFLEKLSPEESKRMNFWSLVAIVGLVLLAVIGSILEKGLD
jgi:hypothetical protein